VRIVISVCRVATDITQIFVGLKMSIKVFIPDRLSRLAKDKFLFEVDGKTVGECLKHLVSLVPAVKRSLFDETGNELGDLVRVFVNKEDVDAEGLEKEVSDGDVIHIVMMTQH